MSQRVYIVEEIGTVVTATAAYLVAEGIYSDPIYYMYGHPREIVNRLQQLTNSIDDKDKKFPLIALYTDIPENHNIPGMYASASLHVIIANLTQPNYYAAERKANNFVPILHPIADAFLLKLSQHKQFTYEGELKYTAIDRYYWGKEGLYGNAGNIFNDFIDAVELRDIQLNIHNLWCLPARSVSIS